MIVSIKQIRIFITFALFSICTVGCTRNESENPDSLLPSNFANDDISENKYDKTDNMDETSTAIANSSFDEKTETSNESISCYESEVDSPLSSAYTWDEWLDDDGHFYYPFDQKMDTSEMQWHDVEALYVIPQRALKEASTYDLVIVCYDAWIGHFSTAALYDNASLFMNRFLMFDAANELLGRDDMAMNVLDVYQENSFLLIQEFDDSDKQSAYDEYAVEVETGIERMELFLARNEAFEQLSDEERLSVLDEVLEKYAQFQTGKYNVNVKSAFAAYIGTLYETENSSLWYNYIKEITCEDENSKYKVLIEMDPFYYWYGWADIS